MSEQLPGMPAPQARELTPTLKVKRMLVYDRYRGVFEGLYESAA